MGKEAGGWAEKTGLGLRQGSEGACGTVYMGTGFGFRQVSVKWVCTHGSDRGTLEVKNMVCVYTAAVSGLRW